MLLFRSEEHVRRWADERRSPIGAIFDPRQGWRLATAWFEDRLSPDWRRKTPDEARAIFADIGLTGAFWDLTSEVSSSDGVDTSGA